MKFDDTRDMGGVKERMQDITLVVIQGSFAKMVGMSMDWIGEGVTGWAIEGSRLWGGEVGRWWTSGDLLFSSQDTPQPAFNLVEEGEGLQEESSEIEGRENTVEID